MDADNCLFESVVFKIEQDDEDWEAGGPAAGECQEYPIDIEEIKVEEPDENSATSKQNLNIMPEFVCVGIEDENYTSETPDSRVDASQNVKINRENEKTSTGKKRKIIRNDCEQTQIKEKHYSCEICSRNFRLKEMLDRHMRIHTEENTHICQICSRKFDNLDTWHHHMLSHAEENINLAKPHACEICSKKFQYEDQLYKHMVRHLENKPHACDVCPAKFRFKSHLNKHLSTHVGKKPHKCLVCSETFYQLNQLNKHVRIHTRNSP